MWEAVERYHQLCYWAPEVREEGAKAGLKGFWMNYLQAAQLRWDLLAPQLFRHCFSITRLTVSKGPFPMRGTMRLPKRSFRPVIELWIEHLDGNSDSLVASETIETAAQMIREVTERISGLGKTLRRWNSLPWPSSPT